MLPESQGNASLQLLTADLHLKRQHVLGLWVQRPERPVPDRGHASWGRAWAGGGWSAGVDSRHTHTGTSGVPTAGRGCSQGTSEDVSPWGPGSLPQGAQGGTQGALGRPGLP